MIAITPLTRRVLLGAALVATIAATVGGGDEQSSIAPARARSERAAPPPVAETTTLAATDVNGPMPAVDLSALTKPVDREPVGDAFEVRSWLPELSVKKGPPPPPQAPPLPFSYMGKMIETDGQITVFLTKQDQNYVIHKGDTIDNTYRVDDVSAGVITLTYMPLKIQQTLAIGSAD